MDNAAVKNYNKGNFKVHFSKQGIVFKNYKVKMEQIYKDIDRKKQISKAVFDSTIPGDM
jgi:glucan biosynthesis protein